MMLETVIGNGNIRDQWRSFVPFQIKSGGSFLALLKFFDSELSVTNIASLNTVSGGVCR